MKLQSSHGAAKQASCGISLIHIFVHGGSSIIINAPPSREVYSVYYYRKVIRTSQEKEKNQTVNGALSAPCRMS